MITTAAESPDVEFARRRRRYAIMAVVFVGTFSAAGIVHRETVLAVLLCVIAMVTLLAAVIMANTRSRPRRADGSGYRRNGERELPSPPTERRTPGSSG